MAVFGLQGLPADAEGVDTLSRYQAVLEMLPDDFSTIWIEDHFQFQDRPTMEGWTLLTYLAALYPRYKFGHLVLSQSYRNPALLAKMAATLQHLTGGRYILGIGAGWHEEEYRAYGYDYATGGVRVGQLAEVISVLRAMWTESPATFHGRWHHIEGATLVRNLIPRFRSWSGRMVPRLWQWSPSMPTGGIGTALGRSPTGVPTSFFVHTAERSAVRSKNSP